MEVFLETKIYSGVNICSENCLCFQSCPFSVNIYGNDPVDAYLDEPYMLKIPSDKCPIFEKRGRFKVEMSVKKITQCGHPKIVEE